MLRIHKTIEIVSSTEVGLSSMGGFSREAAQRALAKHYTSVVVTIVNTPADLEALVLRKPDLVFLGMKYVPVNQTIGRNDPDKIWIADYLDEHEILYTGSDQQAHELELNKEQAKRSVMNAGLNTSPFTLIKRGTVPVTEGTGLMYPLFVKPANRGGGQGIDDKSLVNTYAELCAKVESISTELDADSLAENYLPGREFSVAILKDRFGSGYSVMPIELVAPAVDDGAGVLSAAVKESNTEVVTQVTEVDVNERLCTLAIGVFEALGARDYGRIDIRMDEFGVPHFLEANLLPSLIAGYGSFPKSCVLNADLSYEPMLLAIVDLAFTRNFEEQFEYAFAGNQLQPLFSAS